MDHPAIRQMERRGYVAYAPRSREYGIDALGNEVFKGEEILVLHDEFFLVDELSLQTIETLEILGARYEIAK